jgi:hypothetical protein
VCLSLVLEVELTPPSDKVYTSASQGPDAQRYDKEEDKNCVFSLIITTDFNNGRQFGPSILAPFSTVKVRGTAGFVDVKIIAEELIDDGPEGGNPESLQFHDLSFTTPLTC